MKNTKQTSSIAHLVVVANRLPADLTITPEGHHEWKSSPGGLVTALKPIVSASGGSWIGWSGQANEDIAPFNSEGMHLIPIPLSDQEVSQYYEGFSNASLWPLYHDVIETPRYRRTWWETYRRVNKRFAEATAAVAKPGAPVWVHDYQLQLVPQMLRELRPDLKIGFFNHIPFPPAAIFQQIPWRTQILEGLLGADLIGFQRPQDSKHFKDSVQQLLGHSIAKNNIQLPDTERTVEADAFPISIDTPAVMQLAADPNIQAQAQKIRADLGEPEVIFLGVDRLDYTKGIFHRLKAYGELLRDGRLKNSKVTLVQAASPSRQNVTEYQQLRTEVEQIVSRINGEHSTLRTPAIHYLHQSYSFADMVALYLAADVMLVTSLKDGMNLVAKEYVATRFHDSGALVLSEFTGAADELSEAFLVNPHDIEGMKNAIENAAYASAEHNSQRMKQLRKQVIQNDVHHWSSSFLNRLAGLQ